MTNIQQEVGQEVEMMRRVAVVLEARSGEQSNDYLYKQVYLSF